MSTRGQPCQLTSSVWQPMRPEPVRETGNRVNKNKPKSAAVSSTKHESPCHQFILYLQNVNVCYILLFKSSWITQNEELATCFIVINLSKSVLRDESPSFCFSWLFCSNFCHAAGVNVSKELRLPGGCEREVGRLRDTMPLILATAIVVATEDIVDDTLDEFSCLSL